MTAAVLTAADGGFPDIPGQPYVSPDDLASIGPLWQQAVQQQLVPIVAEVYQTSAGVVHAQMVDATQVPTLPSVGSLAAEQYLAAATNTFEQVGDDLWATARSELLDGFEKGESIDQLAARLRASAGMTAKKATLVARTQVLDASNAGSIATARATGIEMNKGWLDTGPPRTRPTHLQAGVTYGSDAGMIPLADQFTVGGYQCDRPHDPTLPPAEKYNCRCSVIFGIPDDSVDDAVRDAEPVAPIPGTSGVAEPLPDQYAGDLVNPALPGPDLGIPTVPGAGMTMRPALQTARTTTSVSRVFASEYRRITGRDIDPNSLYFEGSVATARQHAEGVLRGMERFPDVPLERVVAFGTGNEYASATSRAIRFNQVWTSPADRKKYLDALAQDEASRWHVPGSGNPTAVALHEFGHVLDTSSDVFKRDLDGLLARTAAARDADLATARAAGELVDAEDFAAGGGVDGLIRRQVSRYGTKNRQELVAEAFTDVMINGDRASDLSRDIFTLLEAEYRRGGGVVRAVTGEALPSLPGPMSTAQFEARATAALRGKAADQRPRVQAEIDAKNSDSATWKATGFDGLDRPVPGGTTAVTTYLRRPAFANDRLRFPDGRPKQDWEPPIDPAKAAKDAAAADRQIANLDKLMAQSPLDSDTVVWRGARPGDIGLPDGDPVGFEWVDRGFVSTTGRRSVAEGSFAQSEDAVLLRILAPDGTPALGFQGLGEAEVLLGRGLTFRVVAEHARLTRPAFSGKKRLPGARVLDVEIIPARPARAPLSVDYSDPALLESGHAQAIVLLLKHGDTPERIVRRYVDDGLSPDMAKFLVDETLLALKIQGKLPDFVKLGTTPIAPAAPAAPVAAVRTVAQLRALAKERGITIPAGSKKPDIVRLLDEGPGAAPVAAPVVEVPLAKRTVAQLRALAADRKITVPKGAKKPDIVRLLEAPPLTEAEQRAAVRALARETNALIEQTSATARVLAEVDELLAKKASASTIREAIADALVEPGQLFAGADPAVLAALRAVASDPVKLRAAVTRLGGKAKIKPLAKAGAKVTFDGDTMEGVGGIDIPAGARVTVVRRGSTVTLPDGTVMQLEKARVTPVTAPVKAAKAVPVKRVPAAKKAPATPPPVKAVPRGATPRPRPVAYQLPPGVTEQDAAELRLALKRRQPIEGMPGADNAGLVERLAVENNADYLLGQFQSHVPAAGRMTTAQIQADLAARAKAAFADRAVATNVDNARLEEILTGGRFKTQFETGRSGGIFQPEERALREEQWFGIPADAAPETRPVYGYLVTSGDGKGLVDVYGGARIVFRTDVRDRTTAMVGDSMEHILTGRPAAVDNPDWYAFTIQYEDPLFAKLDRNYDGPAFNKKAYIEAQIHGGVTVDDIAEVIFTSRPSPELVALLRERGIPWRMRRR